MTAGTASLRALLAGSVDYAGLFPPANLPLGPALENYATYARGEDSHLLARFVLPTARLKEAGPLLAERFSFSHPLRVSALGTKTTSAAGFLESLRMSLGELVSFREAHGKDSAIDQFEAPLPPEITPAPALHALLRQATELIETLLPGPLRAFWEVPFSEDLGSILLGIAEHNAGISRTARCRPFGVKLRTGGTEAAAFPSLEQLANALVAARDADVALKFTAGLHHPIRRFDAGVGTKMHGFLNVFAAGVLARELRLDALEVAAILADERLENFRFDADGFAWCDHHVSVQSISAHRKLVTSFGSCSFDEPRDDLRRAGLM